eukprot:COSAG01_NODE_582_length_15201_cov_7.218315_22_plen_174_part_00
MMAAPGRWRRGAAAAPPLDSCSGRCSLWNIRCSIIEPADGSTDGSTGMREEALAPTTMYPAESDDDSGPTPRRPPPLCMAWGDAEAAPVARRSMTSWRAASALSTGAGGDNGIATMWNRREISVSSCHDQSHYLHPHPVCLARNVGKSQSKQPGCRADGGDGALTQSPRSISR